MRITIIEDTDTGSMYGNDGDAIMGVDLEASEDKFLTMVTDAVHAAYPAAELEVRGEPGGHIPGRSGPVEVDGSADDDRDELNIGEILHNIWESWDWVVLSKAEVAGGR